MREYLTPDFDVTIYEISNEITLNISSADPDGGDDSWFG